MQKTVSFALAANLAAAGTVTVAYPTGTSKGNFSVSPARHKLIVRGGTTYTAPEDFTLTFNANAANITLTWGTGKPTLPAGTNLTLQMDRQGQDDGRPVDPVVTPVIEKVVAAPTWTIDLGSPAALSTTGIATAQLLGSAGNLTIDGTVASGGVATLDVPRNFTLTVATTNQSGITFTVTGTDEYGVTIKESLAGPNNNTVSGKKAFKTITQVAANAAIATNGVSVGFGDVLGLPVFLPSTALILAELEDGAAASAGTKVAGVTSKATATTGDVRGTYDPNSACDGSKGFKLLVALSDPTAKGVTQFAG